MLVILGGFGVLLLVSSLLVDFGCYWLFVDLGYLCNRYFLCLVEGVV